jgi:hypothetical protein
MNAWLNRLVELAQPDNPSEFKSELAEDIVKVMEQDINRSDVGVIGGPKFKGTLNDRIIYISKELTRFLEKSPYSKESFAAKLENCYNSVDCPYNNCGVYDHGSSLQSSYDFT